MIVVQHVYKSCHLGQNGPDPVVYLKLYSSFVKLQCQELRHFAVDLYIIYISLAPGVKNRPALGVTLLS
jgi:hypothetical protein